jgi:predicted 2-oxoglutarate/Fe(II)-dependent dioxygenase YbiX
MTTTYDLYEIPTKNGTMTVLPTVRNLQEAIVLNDDFEGGALCFEEMGLRWEPVAGSAIFLTNTSTKTMVHEVEKVTSGERFSINTFWTAS